MNRAMALQGFELKSELQGVFDQRNRYTAFRIARHLVLQTFHDGSPGRFDFVVFLRTRRPRPPKPSWHALLLISR
jgi:hypothetical protein